MRSHTKPWSAGFNGSRGVDPATHALGLGARIATALFSAALLLCAFTAAPALAKEAHAFSTAFAEAGSGNGQLALAEHSGLAVNQTTHDLYVADTGNGRVEQFEADGTFVRTFGSFTNPLFVAIDNSGGPSAGDVYVADTATGTVAKFQPDGTSVSGWGTSGQLTGFSAIAGIAVDTAGNFFVLEENRTTREYAQDGTAGAVFEAPSPSPNTAPFGLAIDVESHLSRVEEFPAASISKYTTTGEYLGQFDTRGDAVSLTIDPFDNGLYVVQSGDGGFVNRFALNCGQACTPVESFGLQEGLASPQGVAVDATSHHVYVANAADNTIAVFTLQDVEPPSATIDAPSAITYQSAHVSGEVDPEGHGTSCRFEYVTDAQFQAEGFEGAQSTPCAANPGSGNSPVAVQADLTGLQMATTYHVRLAATNAAGTAYSAEPNPSFETETVNPPEVEIDPASAITGDSAHLSGTVNSGGSGPGEATKYRFECSPGCKGLAGFQSITSDGADQSVEGDAEGLLPNTEYTITLTARNVGGEVSDQTSFTTDAIGPEAATGFVAPRTTTTARLNAYITPNNSPTTYYFQYGTSDCSANPCTSVPLSEDAAVSPTDVASHLVSQEVGGLSESTTYHYRVIAENSAGTVTGADKTFETRSAAEMTLAPRGYELVNPPDKGNQNIERLPEVDGIGGRESVLNTPDGENAAWEVLSSAPGATVGTENPFLSTRGPDGWSTISMLGPASMQYGGGNKFFRFVAASTDLSHFIFLASEGVLSAAGSTIIRGDRAGNQEVLQVNPGGRTEDLRLLDVSADTRHVYRIEPEIEKLIDVGSGTREEVGLMPDGSSPPCNISAFYRFTAYHWISRDGSRVFFQSRGSNCGGPQGVYVRNRDAEETTQLTPDGRFIRASRDGRRAVFLTPLALTGEDPNTTQDLYMWSEGGGVDCLTCVVPNAELQGCGECVSSGLLPPGPDYGAVEVSEDLSRVYFYSPNELVPGERKGGGTYVITTANGAIHYAGSFGLKPEIGSAFGEQFTQNYARLTPDGHAAVIRSSYPLTDDAIQAECPPNRESGQPHPCTQIYYYDDLTRSTECVSCVQGGVTPGEAGEKGFEMSDDGHTVIFETSAKLVPGDVNGGRDIYQWHDGKVGLITDGVTKFPGGAPDDESLSSSPTVRGISADGRDVFFTIVAPLTGFEQDGLSNLYDARIGGGFPPPARPVHCEGDSCQGSLDVPPPSVRSASSTFAGNGNVKEGAKARCRRAKVRRKGRCVSKRPSCRKQAKAKKRCAKRRAGANPKRSQPNHRGGSK